MRCDVCGKAELEEFFRLSDVPVFCNVLWPNRDEALGARRGEIRLGFCGECGHMRNMAFDSSLVEYTEDYRNPLHCSQTFRQYAENLSKRLIERHGLRGKDIIEIGCGDGYFLDRLCRDGNNRGVGFEPSRNPGESAYSSKGHMKILAQEYGQGQRQYPVDFICCRHVLEHVDRPREFLAGIRETIGDRCGNGLYFEVPNAVHSLENLGIWDIIYEHCSYFVLTSLKAALERAGFESVEVGEAYEEQFLYAEAMPSTIKSEGLSEWPGEGGRKLTERFAEDYDRKVDSWRGRIEGIRQSGRRAVVWGCGSKGVSFLNVLDIGQESIEYVIDADKGKCGRFVPGTGQEVVAAEFLKEYRPEVIIVMNPIYQEEIEQLVKQMSVDSKFLVA